MPIRRDGIAVLVTRTMDFSLAHLSDLHLPLPATLPPWRQLAGKRLLAFLSWQRKRRRIHTLRPLEALLADLATHAPDHVAITGDLTNLALPSEFIAARRWIDRLGPPGRISVVPGNHDRMVAMPWAPGLGQWAPWMAGDPPTADDAMFPFLRRRGPLAIIGLSSAVPTPPGSAAGQLGTRQVEQAAALLDWTGREGLCRVVLIHHPPIMGEGGRRKALRDRASFCAMLKRSGAELVLHGHHHVSRLLTLPGPAGPILLLGVPSASAGVARPELARWHLHRIARDGAGWRLTTQARGYDPGMDRFRQVGEWTARLGGGSVG